MNFFALSVDYVDDPQFFRKLKKYTQKNPPFQMILNIPLDETTWSRYSKIKQEYKISHLRLQLIVKQSICTVKEIDRIFR